MKIHTPGIALAIATALASTTGYCVLMKGPTPPPEPTPAVSPPVRLLPPAIVPFSVEPEINLSG